METLTLYSTGCPLCETLKRKLDAASLSYEIITDQKIMEELGFTMVPVLKVKDQFLNFSEAVKWIKEKNK